MNKVRLANMADRPGWLKLAKEVEPLFGPMADDPGFHEGLAFAIQQKNAFCIADEKTGGDPDILGGIVISTEKNEIVWLAVAHHSRCRGMGAALLSEAINGLDKRKDITVTTFDRTVLAGLPARRLYQSLGFNDDTAQGLNPAGFPTVTMVRTVQMAKSSLA